MLDKLDPSGMMAHRYEAPHRIYFRLAGEELETVIRWQQAIDLEVMRYQIDTFGSAIVLKYKGSATPDKPLQRLKKLPQPGEALPWYGDVRNLSYAFIFRSNGTIVFPMEGGHLRVVNEAGGSGIKWFPPHKFPPLELEIPDRFQVEPTQPRYPSAHRYGLAWGWWYDWAPGTGVRELIFEIGDHLWQHLKTNGWMILIAEGYEYIFRPTAVGMDIVLYSNITSEETIQLTKSMCW